MLQFLDQSSARQRGGDLDSNHVVPPPPVALLPMKEQLEAVSRESSSVISTAPPEKPPATSNLAAEVANPFTSSSPSSSRVEPLVISKSRRVPPPSITAPPRTSPRNLEGGAIGDDDGSCEQHFPRPVDLELAVFRAQQVLAECRGLGRSGHDPSINYHGTRCSLRVQYTQHTQEER